MVDFYYISMIYINVGKYTIIPLDPYGLYYQPGQCAKLGSKLPQNDRGFCFVFDHPKMSGI